MLHGEASFKGEWWQRIGRKNSGDVRVKEYHLRKCELCGQSCIIRKEGGRGNNIRGILQGLISKVGTIWKLIPQRELIEMSLGSGHKATCVEIHKGTNLRS